MKKRVKLALITMLLFTIQTIAQQPIFEWAKQFGNPSASDRGNAVTTDASGNVYIIGDFSGTVDFDPGASVYNLTSINTTTFVLKLDANGSFIWAKYFEIPNNFGYSSSGDIQLDNLGNIYITGSVNGNIDADPNLGSYVLTGGMGITGVFAIKLDANGNFVWGNIFNSNTSGNGAEGRSLIVDNLGNTYITGQFEGSLQTNSGILTANSLSAPEAFVLKLDTNGISLWERQIGGWFDFSVGNDIVANNSGGIYFTGRANGDIIISKLDVNGNTIWMKGINGGNAAMGNSILKDSNGNIYVAGFFTQTGDFDPGAGVFTLTNAGLNDGFLSKLDSNGNFVWAKQYGGSSYDRCKDIGIDALGNIYITGFFDGTVDFDPNINVFNLTTISTQQCFITKVDANGNFIWAVNSGGSGNITNEIGHAITVDVNDNIYTTGYFTGLSDFDPGIGAYNFTSSGTFDAYVLKLNQNITTDVFETRKGLNFIAYPNPTNNQLTIKGDIGLIQQIKIIELLGKTIKTMSSSETINVSDLNTGIYFIEITTNEKTLTQRFIKN